MMMRELRLATRFYLLSVQELHQFDEQTLVTHVYKGGYEDLYPKIDQKVVNDGLTSGSYGL